MPKIDLFLPYSTRNDTVTEEYMVNVSVEEQMRFRISQYLPDMQNAQLEVRIGDPDPPPRERHRVGDPPGST